MLSNCASKTGVVGHWLVSRVAPTSTYLTSTTMTSSLTLRNGYAKKNINVEEEQAERDDIAQAKLLNKELDNQYDPHSYSGHYVRDPNRKNFKGAFSPKDLGRIKTTKQMLEAVHAGTVETNENEGGYDEDEEGKKKPDLFEEDDMQDLGEGEEFDPELDGEENEMSENYVVNVGRHVKVTKGGRVQSFSTLVFIGNGAGTGGLGYGKGDTAAVALKRASRDAERNAITINRYQDKTLPCGLDLKFRSTKIRFYKTGDDDEMVVSGDKQDIIMESFGLHGVNFRTYGRRSWRNIFNVIQKKLPDFVNPDEIARLTGKKLITRQYLKEKRETLADLLASKIPEKDTDPYDFGLIGKFLYDLEKPVDRKEQEALLMYKTLRQFEKDDTGFDNDDTEEQDSLERGTTDPMSKFKRKRFIDSQKYEDSRKLHSTIKH
ncbi:hypothetical protein SAMD00019534_063290 [Acytostelium subglobosum LB1]|uniref:hypothetical protein n=1 Tax=Acytostelium subglobosum LB1 TaxID=1410327 RepID=UPI0006452348|nr:hypothetical protein SAMD00019534_063290 [Acytostelium subglobosum LB1]GAM23154.1 hypothetical protein SAMD00019534_063290 [Acytostelium subglobosum LB1]|eukprot:XP_012753603.1 hypothetical protein SAMD00019534_063290 [Acytostelium subglobosum LB1]